VTDLVFDATPLSHFARAGVLHILENIIAPFRCIAPAEVMQEIIRGVPLHPALAAAVSLPWMTIVELREAEVLAFAGYKSELGGGIDRNNGEAAVLAWTSVNGGTAIIDERAGTRAARRDNIQVHGDPLACDQRHPQQQTLRGRSGYCHRPARRDRYGVANRRHGLSRLGT
jgi:predicted nucleic acid-binding protein